MSEAIVTSTGDRILVVVDVEFCLGISGAGRFKGDTDKVLSQDVVEHAGSQGAVLVEDLIDHVLGLSATSRIKDFTGMKAGTGHTHA